MIKLISAAILLISPALVAEEATYQRESKRYVMAAGQPVEAACDAGDTVVKGDCLAVEKFKDEDSRTDLGEVRLRTAEKGIYLNSAANKDINGWRCETTHQDARQLLRITARVVCQMRPAS